DTDNQANYDYGATLPISVVASDFTGDGKPDLVVACAGDPDNNGLYANFGQGTAVTTFQNGGSGAFGPGTSYTTGFKSAFAVAVADLNLDGVPDLAICDLGYPSLLGTPTPGGVAVYLGSTKAGGGFNGF